MRVFDLAGRPKLQPPPVVTVNGVVIPSVTIAREAQHHPASSPGEALEAAARALVVRELLMQEARRLGVVPEPMIDEVGRRETEEEALISTLLRHEVKVPEADWAATERYWRQNQSRFQSAPLYEARHILFAARRDDTEAYARARSDAEAAIATLEAAPERFAALAEALSACPSAKAGGNLGQITADSVTPEFADALERAEPGTVHPEPVETRYGVHVLGLERRIPGRTLPFEACAETIKAFLEARVWQAAVRQYLQILAGRAEIGGIELEAAPTPLVQ